MSPEQCELVDSCGNVFAACIDMTSPGPTGQLFAKAADTIIALKLQTSELKAEINRLRQQIRNQQQVEQFNKEAHANLQTKVNRATNCR